MANDFESENKRLKIPKIPGLEELYKFSVPWGKDAHFALVGVIIHPQFKSIEKIDPDGRYVGVIAFFSNRLAAQRGYKIADNFGRTINSLGWILELRRTEVCNVLGGESFSVLNIAEVGFELEERRQKKTNKGNKKKADGYI
jgi:hypothetical protein